MDISQYVAIIACTLFVFMPFFAWCLGWKPTLPKGIRKQLKGEHMTSLRSVFTSLRDIIPFSYAVEYNKKPIKQPVKEPADATLRLCKDCKAYVNEDRWGFHGKCGMESTIKKSPVDGHEVFVGWCASTMRNSDSDCGPQGKWWKPKE